MRKPCPAYIVIDDQGTRRYCWIEHERPNDSTHVGDRTEEQYRQQLRVWKAWKRSQSPRPG